MSYIEQVRLAKGFILYKLKHLGYTSGEHTSIDNLPKSCPVELRPFIPEAIRQLLQERHLLPKPTSYGRHVTMMMSKPAFEYANLYAIRYGLEQEEYGKPQNPEKTPPLSPDVLRALKFPKKRKS